MDKLSQVFQEKFLQAWTACMLCMVQGDVTVLTLNHALTASKTGVLTAIGFILATWANVEDSQWKLAWITGVVCTASDIIVHPTHFGEQWLEAFCTGLGAAFLCLLWERTKGHSNGF